MEGLVLTGLHSEKVDLRKRAREQMCPSQIQTKALAAEERSQEPKSFVRPVRSVTRRKYNPEEKICIVLEGLPPPDHRQRPVPVGRHQASLYYS